jgi:signal transduction histidine kinase/DNA-binding response OmpR family regulator
VRTFGRRDGLFDETLHAVLEDARHDLWISSNRGIFRIARADLDRYRPGQDEALRCRVYDESNGMPSREANGGVQGTALEDTDGRMWFATQAGVVAIDPGTVGAVQQPPPVVIEEASSELTTLPAWSGAVRIGPKERDLVIGYAAISFGNQHDLRFRYRLAGHDRDWVAAGERREAFYSQLPPGRYRFEVEAAASDGPWSPVPATLAVEAEPFLWETWWFQALVGLAAAGLAIGLIRARVHGLAERERALSHEVTARTATIEAQAVRLRALDEAKTRFFADVSHEFRTPLTLTIGPIEDLLEGAHGPLRPDAAEQLELALRNARRALRQVNRLLDLAKLEAGAMRIAAGPGDAIAHVREMVATFRPQAERKGLTLMENWPDASPVVYFDAHLLEQAVANLLSNAIKFTPPGGAITVEARVEDAPPPGWLAIVVCDSGPGIPEDERRRVFDRFHQVPGSRSRLSAGTGIGLSLTREIVELHGGRIELASSVGEGSAFTIRFRLGNAHLADTMLAPPGEAAGAEPVPSWLFADAAPRGAGSAVAVAGPGADDAQTVLLIEDDADVREYVGRLLAPHFRVVTATDGAQGLALARQAPPDCIVSDVMMPGMDGYALCRAVKEDPELEFVPVVLLTARTSPDHRIEGLSLGADDYLAKPFHAPELLLRIRNLIAVRRGLREKLRPRELHPRPIAVTAADDVFLARVREAIEERMGDEAFTVGTLAEAIGYERSRLYRRLRDAGGHTPEALIKQFRLERAAQLLTARAGSVSEIAYAVGFKSVTHFCKVFKDRYGTSPGAFSARPQTA